jgi:hypothetical protein
LHNAIDEPISNTYEIDEQCRLYVLEEKRYALSDGLLQYRLNADDDALFSVSSEISNFQVRVGLADGTWADSFDGTASWSDLVAIEVTLQAEGEVEGRPIVRVETGRFFPRNALSR